MSISLTNVHTSGGNYRFTESGTRFEYWPSSGDLYRLTPLGGEWTFQFVRTVQGVVNRQQLLDALSKQVDQGFNTNDPNLDPSGYPVTQPVGGTWGTPAIGSPRYVPVPLHEFVLGTVPQTVQNRVGGIGVVPGISPVRFDKSYRPKQVDMHTIPTTAEGMWEFIRNVVGEQIRQTPLPNAHVNRFRGN
tara:strand:+ start:716 stop:1282 length:567 start_codon:yes stop_codon:yes gene_type:complete